jgi:hypothetical protein
MKHKTDLPNQLEQDADMASEYDFRDGARGKHARAFREGYSVTIHYADGSEATQYVKPDPGAVILAPDVRKYFPDSESVNRTLRQLIELIPSASR